MVTPLDQREKVLGNVGQESPLPAVESEDALWGS